MSTSSLVISLSFLSSLSSTLSYSSPFLFSLHLSLVLMSAIAAVEAKHPSGDLSERRWHGLMAHNVSLFRNAAKPRWG